MDASRGIHDKTVELEVPGLARRAVLTGSAHDRSVIATVDGSGGRYEPHLMARVQAILEPDSVSLDIGANIGALTIAMAWASPRGRVHCFEAAPSNFRYLRSNLTANLLENVTAENLALYDERSTLEISYVEEVAGCSFISPTGVREGCTEIVEALPLDDWVAEGGLAPGDRVRLIKLDVEGAERRVILGARRTLREHQPHLLVEFNPTTATRFFGEDPRELYELLASEFRVIERVESPGGSLAPVDSYEHLLSQVARAGGWLDLECRS